MGVILGVFGGRHRIEQRSAHSRPTGRPAKHTAASVSTPEAPKPFDSHGALSQRISMVGADVRTLIVGALGDELGHRTGGAPEQPDVLLPLVSWHGGSPG
jgi:hypothetical protein